MTVFRSPGCSWRKRVQCMVTITALITLSGLILVYTRLPRAQTLPGLPPVQLQFSPHRYKHRTHTSQVRAGSTYKHQSNATQVGHSIDVFSMSYIRNMFVNTTDWGEFERTLHRSADVNGSIITSIVDSQYVEFALNFVESSIHPLEITNYVPICLDAGVHGRLGSLGVSCVLLVPQSYGAASANTSDFGSSSYYFKTNIKTILTLSILQLGVSVLVVDLDVILFRDPFPYFVCSDCDLHITTDRVMYNSGFVFARVTPGSVAVYATAWAMYRKYHRSHDQSYLNSALQQLTSSNVVKVEELSKSLFQCGLYYFEHGFRMFRNNPPCPECVMVHNNYMGSQVAKIYRFKENLMWHIDVNSYYSNPDAKYITYSNPSVFAENQWDTEIAVLKQALFLGHVMNRTLILPTFRCCRCDRGRCDHPRHRCCLLSMLRVNVFDQHFSGSYREHSFLDHFKVPASIKSSISPELFINTTHYGQMGHHAMTMPDGVPTISAATGWLSRFNKYAVLHFNSLYTSFVIDHALTGTLDAAIQCAHYDQWNPHIENKWL